MTMEWYGNQVISSVNNARKGALTMGAQVVQASAVLRAPVDTGNLRGSLTYEVGEDEARIGTNVDYAPWVESGTDRMAAQPYLRPALDENKAKIERELGLVVGKAAEAGGRK